MRNPSVILLLLIALCASSPALACPGFKMPPEKMSGLLGRTSELIPEIARGRSIADQFGAELALYGGLERELQEYVCTQLKNLGSVERFEGWLATKPSIQFVDFHRAASDLDFLLVPNEAGPFSADRLKALNGASKAIESEFPGNAFYTKFDINVQPEFFAKYPPGNEHFEAISNVPVGRKGVIFLEDLDVTVDGKKANLARWGLQQSVDSTLDLRLNPDGPKDAASMLKQVLRDIRQMSEKPEWQVSDETKAAVRAMVKDLQGNKKSEVLSLLKAGDQEMRVAKDVRGAMAPVPHSTGGKVIVDLEKLQIYSGDSLRTRRLLDEFGITGLAKDAGIYDSRILTPLPERAPGVKLDLSKRLGKEVTVKHRTQLEVAQNMGGGALWESDGHSVIRGRETKTLLDKSGGIYAADGPGHMTYGSFAVDITLSPDAIEGVDYQKLSDGVYIIKTRQAIARNADGSMKISKINMASLVSEMKSRLGSTAVDAEGHALVSLEEKHSILRGLASIAHPEDDPAQVAEFDGLLADADRLGDRSRVLKAYFERSNVAKTLWTSNSPFAQRMKPLLQQSFTDGTVTFLDPATVAKVPELKKLYIESRLNFLIAHPYMEGQPSWTDVIPELLGPLHPETDPKDAELFWTVLKGAVTLDHGSSTWKEFTFAHYLERPGVLNKVLADKTEFGREARALLHDCLMSYRRISIPKEEFAANPQLKAYLLREFEQGASGAATVIEDAKVPIGKEGFDLLKRMAAGPDENAAESAVGMAHFVADHTKGADDIDALILARQPGRAQVQLLSLLHPEDLEKESPAVKKSIAAAFSANRQGLTNWNPNKMVELNKALGRFAEKAKDGELSPTVMALIHSIEHKEPGSYGEASAAAKQLLKLCPQELRCQKAAVATLPSMWSREDFKTILMQLAKNKNPDPSLFDPILGILDSKDSNQLYPLRDLLKELTLTPEQEARLLPHLTTWNESRTIPAAEYFFNHTPKDPAVLARLRELAKAGTPNGEAAAQAVATAYARAGDSEALARYTLDFYGPLEDYGYMRSYWVRALARNCDMKSVDCQKAVFTMVKTTKGSWEIDGELGKALAKIKIVAPEAQDSLLEGLRGDGAWDFARQFNRFKLDLAHERKLAGFFVDKSERVSAARNAAAEYFTVNRSSDPEVLRLLQAGAASDDYFTARKVKETLKSWESAGPGKGCSAAFAKITN